MDAESEEFPGGGAPGDEAVRSSALSPRKRDRGSLL